MFFHAFIDVISGQLKAEKRKAELDNNERLKKMMKTIMKQFTDISPMLQVVHGIKVDFVEIQCSKINSPAEVIEWVESMEEFTCLKDNIVVTAWPGVHRLKEISTSDVGYLMKAVNGSSWKGAMVTVYACVGNPLSNTGLEGAKLDEPPRGNSGGGSLGGQGRGGDGQSAGSSDVERSKPGGSRQQKRSCQQYWQVRS